MLQPNFIELARTLIDDVIPILQVVRTNLENCASWDTAEALAAIEQTIKGLRLVAISLECSR